MKALSLLGIALIALAQATAPAFAEEKAADAAKPEAAAEAPKADAATDAPAADAAKIDGEKVYKGLCMSCHDAGVAGSPKLGDKAAWEPRIATGMDALYESSLKGKGVMPAKGGNPALSDDEVKAAVDYMVAQVK
ncbi:c-type cytochrome [Thiothrix subterranea]|uniref:C-type cytochrome n=1 Tax=Thiothrix subterranea TaxID=2735563 RepID=A0AA51MKZ9_9GAMM|nr:c-type cytochrome [Thiothrix subterranea]MDQ5768883.1 c-type cytochrome [Thiothrix subterranea]QQZ27782.1 cytochrome c5 family protein [Thiothrix subterranea]WML86200.1 c-type cytochrome [Thiothrix subterranea]